MFYLSNLQLEILNGQEAQWPDTLDCNVFCYILSGQAQIHMGSQVVLASPGELLLLPAGSGPGFCIKAQKGLAMHTVHFSAVCLDMDLLSLIKLPLKLNVEGNPEVKSLMDQISSFGQGMEIASALRQKACLLRLIAFYINHTSYKIRCAHYEDELLAIMSYIDNNLDRDISIQELADRAHLHPNYFCRFFKKHTGLTPMDYIASKRIAKAKELLLSTRLPINQIALMTGFSDYNYFSRQFKHYTDFTPGDYRKLHGRQEVAESVE